MFEESEKKKLRDRLRRIEGQVAGIGRMIEGDDYCVEVLRQISAARAALEQVSNIVLANHIETCVAESFTTGSAKQRQNKIGELVSLVSKYRKP
jgi:CsoR family transcriptional regulator, copper-sensing transcriptional repressor